MRRLILAVALAAGMLSGCATAGGGGVPPAPLESTVIDEKAITLAARAVDTAALAASSMVRLGVIQPGTPDAQAIARGLDDARNFVNAAAAAREAGNARSAAEAIDKAGAALAAVQTALRR